MKVEVTQENEQSIVDLGEPQIEVVPLRSQKEVEEDKEKSSKDTKAQAAEVMQKECNSGGDLTSPLLDVTFECNMGWRNPNDSYVPNDQMREEREFRRYSPGPPRKIGYQDQRRQDSRDRDGGNRRTTPNLHPRPLSPR
jgi:hypothetical protein